MVNKSGIMRNFDKELPAVSPHWPGLGRYIGLVDDEKPILFETGKDFSCFDFYDKYDYQRRRIYEDEVPGKKVNEKSIAMILAELMYGKGPIL